MSNACQRLLPWLPAVFALAGCTQALQLPRASAPPPTRAAALQRVQAATPCCRAWSELGIHAPLPATPREFTIDRFTPVAELAGGRTHFLGFVLPAFAKPYRIAFQAQPSARHLGNSFLFAPTVTVLDADFKPLSSTDVPLCVYISWRPGMSGAFGAVTIRNPEARYVVVTTSQQQLAAHTYWAQSPTSFSNVNAPATTALAGVKSAAPVSSGSFDVAHGPEGALTLGRMTSAYASAVDNGLCGKPKPGPGLLPELRRAFQNR